jgi:hypothetical protein
MMYGSGFPIKAEFRSPLINLGGTKNLHTVEWDGDVPLGTRIEIRSWTGNEVVPDYVFFDKNGKTVTEKRHFKLIPRFRGAIDTLTTPGGDWGLWSNAYSTSGEQFLSPSPRQFMELNVQLTSDEGVSGASLDWLGVNFTAPCYFFVYKLSGRRIYQMHGDAVAGRASFSWDGRDDADMLVPPGFSSYN